MFTTVHWGWLIAQLRSSSLIGPLLQGNEVSKLTFETPDGKTIEVPAGSKVLVWMEERWPTCLTASSKI